MAYRRADDPPVIELLTRFGEDLRRCRQIRTDATQNPDLFSGIPDGAATSDPENLFRLNHDIPLSGGC